MKETCKVCRKWQSHFYWNHMDPKNVKFFVKMEASFMNHLILPRNFARRFKGQTREIVKLRGPSGDTWRIEAHKSENKLSLKSGWRKFVTANKIDKNDLLVFKYRGNSSFNVLIFDSSGCEKVVSLIIKNDEPESESESESESETESTFECEAEKTCSESDTSFRVYIPPERKRMSSDSETSSSATCEQKRKVKNGDEASSDINKKARKGPSDMPYSKSRAKLTVSQQKIADEMAVATQPGSKLFVKILTPSDISHYLIIPKCSANEYIGETSQSISLLLANKNKVFPGHYYYNKNMQFIRRGWKDFVRQCNMKAHSLCLFEVKTLDGGIAIVVHVHPSGN